MFTTRRFAPQAATLLLAGLTLFSSCKNDDDATTETTAPSSYNFENASYSGQTIRLKQLDVLTAEMKSANTAGVVLSEDKLLAIYSGDSAQFDFDTDGKNLSSKTETEGKVIIEDWINKLVQSSIEADTNSSSSTGARQITSTNGDKTYLVAANGFEYNQMITKGIMGSVFYYQATSDYLYGLLSDDNTTNLEGKDYTAMEHHFDEAFGYFGAPTTFSSTSTEGAQYHASYSSKGQGAGLNTSDDIMDAFIKGRFAVSENEMGDLPTYIAAINENWEETIYASGLHYLKGAQADFSDKALRCHQLSEAYAFIWSLQFNISKSVTNAQINEVLDLLGDDFFSISTTDIAAAQTKLVEIFAIPTDVVTAL